MPTYDIELKDNPVLNMLRVNKWMRENLERLQLMHLNKAEWQQEVYRGSGVYVPDDVVAKLCWMNTLTVLETKLEGVN